MNQCVILIFALPSLLGCNMDIRGHPNDRKAVKYLALIGCSPDFDEQGFISGVSLNGATVPADQAMEELDSVWRAGGLRHVKGFGAVNTSLTDDGLRYVANWPDVREIYLLNSQVTGRGILDVYDRGGLRKLEKMAQGLTRDCDLSAKALGAIPTLRHVNFFHSDLTDQGLSWLANSRSIEYLDITNTPTTGQGIGQLEVVTSLRVLLAGETGIDDEALIRLASLPALELLSAHDSGVSDAGLAVIERYPMLRRLGLAKARVGDIGVARLRNARKLESLTIAETNVTDKVAESLLRMPSLRYVRLDGTQVGRATVCRMRELRPMCQVIDLREPDE